MEYLNLPPLEVLDMSLHALPSIDPNANDLFRVPRLTDKPQNPIIDTLAFWNRSAKNRTNSFRVNRGERTVVPSSEELQDVRRINANMVIAVSPQDVWRNAFLNPPPLLSLTSWDAVQRPIARRAQKSAFFSEQSASDTTAGMYYAHPPLQSHRVFRRHISPEQLFESLRWTIIGASSGLHVWDPQTRAFVLRNTTPKQQGILVVTGMDEATSERFVLIGVMIRRVDTFIHNLRKRRLSPVFHAFVHAISTIASFNMDFIATSPLLQLNYAVTSSARVITSIWVHYADLETRLLQLASFCRLEDDRGSLGSQSLPETDVDLLSHAYDQLLLHLEKQSQPSVVAQFAYIFSGIAQAYFEDICAWVGYPSRLAPAHMMHVEDSRARRRTSTVLDDDSHERSIDSLDPEEEDRPFPTFLPEALRQALAHARRSLVLLRAAQPNHHILTTSSLLPSICWFWTENEVKAAFSDEQPTPQPTSTKFSSEPAAVTAFEDEMRIFEDFDLEPGSLNSASLPASYRQFTDRFPRSLPSLTPTMPDLTTLVLKPLTRHIGALSGALVDLFLSEASDLYFPLHLRLLQSFLLLSSPAFKSTLQSALFSDYFGTDAPTGLYTTHGRRNHAHSSQPPSTDVHSAIGISQELAPDGSWPPAGASLSFFLRTVVIDSLNLEYRTTDDIGMDMTSKENEGRKHILQEAEWRLGFAIRDLPTGSNAKWLDARSMEALDFLYMEYQPPEPLATLITPTILSKYHRIFAFNLRLMRVDNVVRALFRFSRRNAKPVFPTFTASQKLFFHFRFVSHAFVAALSSYVYDIALGSNFDAFLAVLAPSPEAPSRQRAAHFPDVFALSEYHSSVMDDILSACLLRSGQKPVGDLLRGALEIILAFGLLMSDIVADRMEEYDAVAPLEELFRQFYNKVTTVVKVLNTLVERGAMAGRPSAEHKLSNWRPVSRVTDCLSDLLVRIDVAEWWRHRTPQRDPE
ncbi:hypothetical protein EIP91_006644 [Steccherinum ochraceum]|uniref:Spindle pole body component n=1 Tax=Steccherinum ochraceum TaxID=92696 RepID=A0A4R0RFY9_9APHY|nr:hypothetical protein EIP91_006644 [Steccherinum ochraceum]